MSTSALEEKVTRNLTQTRALDAEFEAFKANTRQPEIDSVDSPLRAGKPVG
jgi:hypothetical protein